VLEVDRVSKRYGELVALQDMTFGVNQGELFGFVGSNGAGKTTTMRIILGVLAADAGQVRWNGKLVTLETRRHIGYMPEDRGLYPQMKVGEQLEHLGRLHGMSKVDARRAVGYWLDRLDLWQRRGDTVQKLSHGNQQRVQLAAAVLHEPEVLVLDEPFAGLDPVAVDVMSEVLTQRCAAGVPVIFSSHQLDLVERLCHRVGIVRRGEMVACGTVDELRAGAAVQVIVQAPQAASGWADAVPGVLKADYDGDGRTVLELDPRQDDQAVLAAALATGPVREFARRRPNLTELFREVVKQ
jgi:ABC-2 type transport system ATP-binding protein